MTITLADVRRILTNPSFLNRLGEACSVSSGINNIMAAIASWKGVAFEEARFVAWESMRTRLIQHEERCSVWKCLFSECKELLVKDGEKVDGIKALAALTQESLIEFVEKLPFLGALGESLIQEEHPENNFFLSQIPIYQEGHWVCGWEGVCSLSPFLYPDGKYLIY